MIIYQLVLGIAVIISFIYLTKNEDERWIVFFEGTGINKISIEKIFSILRSKGISCRLKNISSTFYTRMAIGNTRKASRILVKIEDLDRAKKILKEIKNK